MASATTCADSSAAATPVLSGSTLLMAAWTWVTRKPVVKALTIAWSAPERRPSITSSRAAAEGRRRETTRAVAIHSQ